MEEQYTQKADACADTSTLPSPKTELQMTICYTHIPTLEIGFKYRKIFAGLPCQLTLH